MKATRFVFLLSSLCLGVSVAKLRAETLTFATYNTENYGAANRVTTDGFRKDYPKPEAEKQALRAVVRALNADILVLQEVGGQPYLDELRRDLKGEGLDYPHAAIGTAVDEDRHIALLSKRRLAGVRFHDDLEFAYFGGKEKVKRGLLEATVATAAGDVTIFAVHLKSRFTDRPDDPLSAIRRAGEATAIRDRILKKFAATEGARFVVLGDCNDGKTSKALEHLQKRGKITVAELLSASDSRGEAWTHVYRRDESYTRVDHVLVSPGLRAAVVGGTARVYDGAGVREASDHRPVVVSLRLEAVK